MNDQERALSQGRQKLEQMQSRLEAFLQNPAEKLEKSEKSAHLEPFEDFNQKLGGISFGDIPKVSREMNKPDIVTPSALDKASTYPEKSSFLQGSHIGIPEPTNLNSSPKPSFLSRDPAEKDKKRNDFASNAEKLQNLEQKIRRLSQENTSFFPERKSEYQTKTLKNPTDIFAEMDIKSQGSSFVHNNIPLDNFNIPKREFSLENTMQGLRNSRQTSSSGLFAKTHSQFGEKTMLREPARLKKNLVDGLGLQNIRPSLNDQFQPGEAYFTKKGISGGSNSNFLTNQPAGSSHSRLDSLILSFEEKKRQALGGYSSQKKQKSQKNEQIEQRALFQPSQADKTASELSSVLQDLSLSRGGKENGWADKTLKKPHRMTASGSKKKKKTKPKTSTLPQAKKKKVVSIQKNSDSERLLDKLADLVVDRLSERLAQNMQAKRKLKKGFSSPSSLADRKPFK